MSKRVWFIVIFSFIVFSTVVFSFAYFNSSSFDDFLSDSVYDISSDTAPLSVVQPSSFAWRVVDGLVQRQNGFGTWGPATLGLDQLFNDYNIATLADVQAVAVTPADIVDALGIYFGDIGGIGFPNTNLYTVLNQIRSATEILYNNYLCSSTGWSLLGSGGLIYQPTAPVPISSIINEGFLGIASQMLGYNAPFTYRMYLPGTSSVTNVTASSLGQILGTQSEIFSFLLQSDVNIPYLKSDGTEVSYPYYVNISSIVANGFSGLGSLLRGESGNQGDMTFLDYTDLTKSTVVSSGNILDILSSGFEANQNLLATYLYSHGTDLDVRERENMEDQANIFVDDFTSSSGPGTPSTGNISDSANMSGSVRDLFSTSSSVADAFTQLGSSGNYSYFSQATANELEPSSVVNSYSRYDDGYRDLFSDKLSSIFSGGGSSW